MTTTTNDKVRSLFLAALMVFSVFAMTVALPGSAAANFQESDADAELDSGTSYWGQEVYFNDTSNGAQGETYQVREWDASDNEVGPLETEVTLDSDQSATFSTDGFSGFYVIQDPDGNILLLQDGETVGRASQTNVENNGLVNSTSSPAFEVNTQTLDVDFDDSNVDDETTDAEYEVDSNRGSFDLNVTANGDLDATELQDLFSDNGTTNGFAAADIQTDEDEDRITIEGVTKGTYEANFTDVDTGEYTLDFEVTDTEASSNASVNVSEAGEGDVAFENDVPQDQIGDVTNVTVQMENTDDATITIGSEDQNYWVVAQVTDDDDDGEVTVAFNSYLAGSDAADSDVLTDATGEDDVTVLSQGGQFYTDNQGAAPYQSLLDATEYEMNVSVGHNAIGSDAWQDADDVGSLSYQERSTDNLSIMTTPSDFSDWEEDVIVAGLGSNVTQTDEIATGDYAVVQLEASGLEGYLESAGETDFLTGNATTLVVEEADPGANADAETIQLDSNDVEVVADANNNTYYVAMPSDAGNFEETEYTAEFTVYDEMQGGPNEGDDNVLNFDEDDEDETVASNFDVVEPEVNLDMNEDDMVLVEAAENQTVSGTANIAPGTELTIEIESDDSTSPFLTRPEATVQPDGTFNASADFSDLSEGTNLTLTIDDYDVEEDGQVVSEGELGGDENVTETETETVTETETDTETEMDTETEADDGDTETDTEASPTDDSGPGFTVVAALGALIAAALLAVRRNN